MGRELSSGPCDFLTTDQAEKSTADLASVHWLGDSTRMNTLQNFLLQTYTYHPGRRALGWPASDALADVFRMCAGGEYRQAQKLLAWLLELCDVSDEQDWQEGVFLFVETFGLPRMPSAGDPAVADTGDSGTLTTLARACELTERIDSLLEVMERQEPTARLARSCRQDLSGLGALSDLCEEQGLHWAAVETRQLQGLVSQNVPTATALPPDPLDLLRRSTTVPAGVHPAACVAALPAAARRERQRGRRPGESTRPRRRLPLSLRREAFAELVEAQDEGVPVAEAREQVALELGIDEAAVLAIEEEGIDNNWPPLDA